MITLDNVSKSFDSGRTHAVRNVSLTVREGELLVLIGESGCGKTTTLKMINRLVEPSDGIITVNGRPVADTDPVELRRGIGYVFQGIGLFPHYTVFENIAAVPRLLRWKSKQIAARVDETLALVGLPPEDYRYRFPSELSGGQQQRVGFARALAVRPPIMLMDEPFGALDPITRAEIQDQVKDIQRDLGLTAVMVTHDMTEAMLLADRVAVMKAGEILQVGRAAELLHRPSDAYVASLVAMPKRRADRLEAVFRAAADAD
ncbi:MAG: ABC transporter ATP-binding protein [Candidatus Hydrogenedentales bacterium]